MKGTIEITQGAVLYVILMLLVVGIGIAIVTGGNFSMLFEQKRLASLFQPGSINAQVCPDNDINKCQGLTSSDVRVLCTDANVDCTQCYNYEIYINNLKFDYQDASGKQGTTFNFLVALDTGKNLFVASDDAGKYALTCTQDSNGYNCGDSKTMTIRVHDVPLRAKDYLHFTIWKTSPGVIQAIVLEHQSLAQLLESFFGNYYGAFDLVGNVNMQRQCLQYACENYLGQQKTEDGCNRISSSCWYNPPWGGLGTGTCNLCISDNCNHYNSQNECERCGSGTTGGCRWAGNACTTLTP